MNNSTDDEPIRIRVQPDLAELIPGFLENRRHDVTCLFEALDRVISRLPVISAII
jgi:hypothetical protein